MWELTSIVVLFLLVSAGVAALARGTTARWERERRDERARRRAAAAAERAHGGRRGHMLPTAHWPTARRMRTLPRPWRVHGRADGAQGRPAANGGVDAVASPSRPRSRPHLPRRVRRRRTEPHDGAAG
jgi:hypothetical protein